MGLLGARGTTSATTTTRLVAACVGRLWRTSAWTQGVRSRALDLWLRRRVVDGCLTGCAEESVGGVRVVVGRVVLARVALQLWLLLSWLCGVGHVSL